MTVMCFPFHLHACQPLQYYEYAGINEFITDLTGSMEILNPCLSL